MDPLLDENFKKQYLALPKELQKKIVSDDFSNAVAKISKDNNLSEEQSSSFEMETLLVLMSIESPSDYTTNLVKNVGLDISKATIVAHDADELIFKDVKNILNELNKPVQSKYPISIPNRDDLLSAIENPSVSSNENKLSVSSLESNKDEMDSDIKNFLIKKPEENLPSVETGPVFDALKSKPAEIAVVKNISPIKNMNEKMSGTIILPKEKIVMEEKTKLPEKPKGSDVYREPIE